MQMQEQGTGAMMRMMMTLDEDEDERGFFTRESLGWSASGSLNDSTR